MSTQSNEVKPKEKLIYCSELKLAVECKLDLNPSDRSAVRFTYGYTGEEVSGSLYIKAGEAIPKMVILMINPKPLDEFILSTEIPEKYQVKDKEEG